MQIEVVSLYWAVGTEVDLPSILMVVIMHAVAFVCPTQTILRIEIQIWSANQYICPNQTGNVLCTTILERLKYNCVPNCFLT